MLLDIARPPSLSPVLENGPVSLRAASFEDHEAWAALRMTSRPHLTAWEPDWRDEEMTQKAFRNRVKAYWREMRRGNALPLFVFRKRDDTLVGGVSLTNIRLGASRSATIGYWIGSPFIRQGLTHAAVVAMLDHAFGAMQLNRIEAACQPENIASRQLLEKIGFQKEGVARDYLFINGAWRDHFLFAITASKHASKE